MKTDFFERRIGDFPGIIRQALLISPILIGYNQSAETESWWHAVVVYAMGTDHWGNTTYGVMDQTKPAPKSRIGADPEPPSGSGAWTAAHEENSFPRKATDTVNRMEQEADDSGALRPPQRGWIDFLNNVLSQETQMQVIRAQIADTTRADKADSHGTVWIAEILKIAPPNGVNVYSVSFESRAVPRGTPTRTDRFLCDRRKGKSRSG